MHEYKNEIAAHLPSIHHPSYMTLIDAAMLYAMIRYHRPATYLEVGSGTSTKIAAAAIEDSDTHTPIISIDPQPRAEVDAICSKVYRCGLEEVDQSLFDSLRPNDILFVDGSHSCFMNSDVTVFFLEILPRLRPGVIVHLHDIWLPEDYPEEWTENNWNEQYILGAYILGKPALQILFPSHYVCKEPELRVLLKPYPFESNEREWTDGGSFWFKTG